MADKQLDRLGREVVRLKQKKTGHELTQTAEWAALFPDGYEVVDKPTVAADGEWLPAKHKTSVAEAAAKKTAPAPSSNEEK